MSQGNKDKTVFASFLVNKAQLQKNIRQIVVKTAP